LFTEIENKFSNCIGFNNVGNKNFGKILVCEENNVGVRCEFVDGEIGIGVVIDKQFEGKCGNLEGKSECEGLKGSNCDGFIYYQSDKKNVIFVELKGSDIEKAVNQILNSIEKFKRIFKKHNYGYSVGAVIVYTGSTPKNIKKKTLKEKLDKELDKNLKPAFTRNIKGKVDITSYVKQ